MNEVLISLDDLLLEYIAQVIGELVAFQHGDELFFKSSLTMVVFLIQNVRSNLLALRLTYGKCTVSRLPLERNSRLDLVIYHLG